MIEVWVNMVWLSFSVKCVILFFKELLLFNLSIFYVLFLFINKMSISMGNLHMVDIVIWVFRAERAQFWTRNSNCSLISTYVFGCISVFLL